MVSVSVHPDVEYPAMAAQYARILEDWKNTHILPVIFGSEGQWEDNKRLEQSAVYKIHIRLPDAPPWPDRLPQARRKSDCYLVYVRHCWEPDRYQVISIMAPDAHELARTSFLAVLEQRAEDFHAS
ncbi:type II toxin-antitoxin system YafO family toxin [Erwinia tracheiphila]|uniref:Type II toxin-antitoxin system YafO family toxin n=1 Tax=Erwinia tracheiphila TaxID=65700 RepID=A0A345CPF6_9GAMM|nr:type II toxin-antitoxin system YafO family toxin [Erwinia tracheiphila]AXF75323.1 type II toxin-antitoxin system YafO family toxin [Erwinia tracheiphila]UIA82131.1 type II toxin-antitoxin system YafO family toxin [Erwinia tracheiphila]UIA90725.1 type II toxin-antitoxin system YafO family toxin [Erwinia tracheiphila]